jgi:hypothetical protein
VRRAGSGPGGFLPRFVPMFVFDHASRAKGGWSDPARVLPTPPTHRAPGRT